MFRLSTEALPHGDLVQYLLIQVPLLLRHASSRRVAGHNQCICSVYDAVSYHHVVILPALLILYYLYIVVNLSRERCLPLL